MLKARACFFCALMLLSASYAKGAQVSPLPQPFDVNLKLTNFKAEQEAKMLTAVALIKKVVASDEFRDRILNHEYEGKKCFKDNLGLTNAQIYQKILNASETLNPGNNNAMDVELELYFEPANTIGHTYPNVKQIWMNTKYYDKFSPVYITDNLFHEWLHKIGFDHEVKFSNTRRFSVPYAIGYLVRELATKYEQEANVAQVTGSTIDSGTL